MKCKFCKGEGKYTRADGNPPGPSRLVDHRCIACNGTGETKEDDPVNHPNHYAGQGAIECIQVIEQLNLHYHPSVAIKYIWRHMNKGNPLEDIEKAIWYLERYRDILKAKEKANERAT